MSSVFLENDNLINFKWTLNNQNKGPIVNYVPGGGGGGGGAVVFKKV